MQITALYGTESGNAEDIAVAIAKAMPERGVAVVNMADAAPDDLSADTFYLIVCSTHGGGELPGFAQFLHDDLDAAAPDLSGVRYAVFGLGDTSYEKSYNAGATQFDALLQRLGAERVGRFGEHDVMTRQSHVDLGVEWAREILDELPE
ncbi:flavodoxin domain-containing protein [Microbacterium sp. LRZ72]|uniref:flavodoxin domain-containing protein n=1 Tax=Microbacterium sp. LRZ72 TaxID=2942481 RepID=UPI0029BE6391|nr:flavodoxin domain-containing protein [Microbacterium sp. LRZ72]MDX2377509.1 flavodoxin domain-containing protein [Microbacterium sp. LRZ72]